MPNTCITVIPRDLDDLAHEIAYWDTELSYGRITQKNMIPRSAGILKFMASPVSWKFTEVSNLSMFAFSPLFCIPDVVMT